MDAIIEDGVNRLLCRSEEESLAGPVGTETARKSGRDGAGEAAAGRDFCLFARRESKYTEEDNFSGGTYG